MSQRLALMLFLGCLLISVVALREDGELTQIAQADPATLAQAAGSRAADSAAPPTVATVTTAPSPAPTAHSDNSAGPWGYSDDSYYGSADSYYEPVALPAPQQPPVVTRREPLRSSAAPEPGALSRDRLNVEE